MKLLRVTGREFRQLLDLENRLVRVGAEKSPEADAAWVEGVREIVGPIPDGEYEVRADWFATSIPLVERIKDL